MKFLRPHPLRPNLPAIAVMMTYLHHLNQPSQCVGLLHSNRWLTLLKMPFLLRLPLPLPQLQVTKDIVGFAKHGSSTFVLAYSGYWPEILE